MGRRGPAAEPVALRMVKGARPGRDSGGRPIPEVPKFDRGAPDSPDWLADEARAVWDRVAPSLESLDLLKPDDREVFAAYCTAWARFAEAVRLYQSEGLTVRNPQSGRISAHPAVSIAESAGRDLLRFAQDFGLTPSAEINLGKSVRAADDGEDPFGAETSA